ncbi:MAG: M48 family metallopeptidase [Alphaproteobacteria bacterium]|nr:M48 family metallopeptidase [Alphaproteobacteria bacterium]
MSEHAALGLTTWRANNNVKSIALIAAFPLLLLALLGATFFFLGLAGGGDPAATAVTGMAEFWPAVVGIAAVWLLIGYFFNGAIIRHATGAEEVTRAQEPKLYDTLETLCISRGLKMPRLHIIDTPVMNAFASGIDEKSYAITVTRGLLDALDGPELEAVLAHELTHIIDRDTRLLIVAIVFVGMISFLAQLLWRSLNIFSFRRGRRDGGAVLVVAIAAVVMAVGWLFALVLRFALSRRRELLADAGSVDLTKNPDALISALSKISANPEVPHVPSEVRQLFIENPPSGFDLGGLFSTHPPIAKRIQILEELGGHAPEASPGGETASPHAAGPAPPGFQSPWR